jgi:two-component system, cell cycle response regulator
MGSCRYVATAIDDVQLLVEAMLMNPISMDLLVERLDNLPTLPGVVLSIIEAVKNENTSLEELGEILSMDPPLSGKILGLINSAFYSLPQEVTSVSQAVKMLGLNTVKKVALSFSLLRLVKGSKEGQFNYAAFWRDSVMAAIVCRLLVENDIPFMAEDAFTLGLLHEIGRLSLNQSMPKQYSLVLKEQQDTSCEYYQAERQILGFTHMELGGALIKKWGLPASFYEPVQFHHLPERIEASANQTKTLGQILCLASQVVGFFSGKGKVLPLGVMKRYLFRWGFDRNIQVEELIEEVHLHMNEISGLFEIQLEDDNAYLVLIEEARRELIKVSDRFLQELLEQQRRVESLKEEIMRDGLTDLYNYKSFHCFVDKEYYRAKRYGLPLTLVMADIDHFKSVNDTFGHMAGDQMLRLISRTLNTPLRNSDIIGRHGGEEFGILLAETPVNDSLIVVERCRRLVESLALECEGEVVKVTMSFGVAFLQPGSDLSKEALIKQADRALYEAKNRGRNQICVYTDNGKAIRRTSQAGVV